MMLVVVASGEPITLDSHIIVRMRGVVIGRFAELAGKGFGAEIDSAGPSRPARGVWIETTPPTAVAGVLVTPRAGRVD